MKYTGNNDWDCDDFFIFVDEMNIIDLPRVGGIISWFSENGYAMNKLDRFLITDNFIPLWKFNNQTISKRVLSDHYLVWLKSGGSDWGLNLLGLIIVGINTKILALL